MCHFGRLIDPAHAEPVAGAKYGQPVVAGLAAEGDEQLKSLDTPKNLWQVRNGKSVMNSNQSRAC